MPRDRDNSSADPTNSDAAIPDDVLQKEHEAIRERRQRAMSGAKGESQSLDDLCGLALSGGGVRSAAMSLGFLEEVRRRGLLKFVDYLSTVSGGGYAGAYLSSAVIAGKDLKAPGEEGAPGDQRQAAAADARDDEGRLEQRILRFIHRGHYLRRTWVFFNRYLIGLLLIWTVLLSGLFAMAAAAALLFRCLDYPVVRTGLEALGFKGDVWLALFPSFVLLVCWAIAWTLSYLKFGPRAKGNVARWLFYSLVCVTLIAVAALIGNGDVALSANSGSVSGETGRTLYAAILSALAASMLPYLAPKKLLRSGLSPRSVIEKYAFWAATRVAAFGIPFAAIAFFTRENISHWNERRDDSLTRMEIGDTTPANPMWRELLTKEGPQPPPGYGHLWSTDEESRSTAKLLFKELAKTSNEVALAQSDADKLETMSQEEEGSRKSLDGEAPSDDPLSPAYEHVAAARTLQEVELSFLGRCTRLATFLFDLATINPDAAKRNQFFVEWNSRFRLLQLQDRLAHQLSEQMRDADFHTRLWPYTNTKDTDSENQVVMRREFDAVYHQVDRGALKPTRLPFDKPDEAFEKWKAELCRLAAEANELDANQAYWDQPPADAARPDETDAELVEAVADDRFDQTIVSMNRRLLEAYFGGRIEPKSTIYSANVLHEDQWTRLRWFLWSGGIFLVASLCVDLNATSLHGFYSAQVGQAWIDVNSSFGANIPLAQLQTTERGWPYQLINGTVQLLELGNHKRLLDQENFLFSQLYCGCKSLSFAPTWEYMDGEYELDDAIAVSGAAISPTLTKNPLILVLLTLANMRLGQWVDNPGYKRRRRSEAFSAFGRWPVTPMRALVNVLRPFEKRRMCFVTDGGHYENLGIESLLLRRCRLIVALDASQDGNFSYVDFTNLVRRMRTMHGIRITSRGAGAGPMRLDEITSAGARGADLDQVDKPVGLFKSTPPKPGDVEAAYRRRISPSHFTVLRIDYGKDAQGNPYPEGCLVYAKSTLTGDEPFDLTEFARREPNFPHDETADQFYDPSRFESYRQLGFHIGMKVCDLFAPARDAAADAASAKVLAERALSPRQEATDASPSKAPAEVAPTAAPSEGGDLQSELAEVARLLDANDLKGALAAMEKVFERGPALFAEMPAILELTSRFTSDAYSPHAALLELLCSDPREAVAALRSVLTSRQGLNRRACIDAVRFLADLWQHCDDASTVEIAYVLKEQLDVAAPASVVVAALTALARVAHDDPEARAKAQTLVDHDPRKAVVRAAKRFLQPPKE